MKPAMPEIGFGEATPACPSSTRPAMNALDLTIKDGVFLMLVGPSGRDKATAPRIRAGRGNVAGRHSCTGDRGIADPVHKARNIVMVLQNCAPSSRGGYPEHVVRSSNRACAKRRDRAARRVDDQHARPIGVPQARSRTDRFAQGRGSGEVCPCFWMGPCRHRECVRFGIHRSFGRGPERSCGRTPTRPP